MSLITNQSQFGKSFPSGETSVESLTSIPQVSAPFMGVNLNTASAANADASMVAQPENDNISLFAAAVEFGKRIGEKIVAGGTAVLKTGENIVLSPIRGAGSVIQETGKAITIPIIIAGVVALVIIGRRN